MATLRDIKRRITSVRSTQQITKAMKMVAAAKLRKVQNKLLSTRPYANEMQQVLAQVAARSKEKRHPLMEIRKPRRALYVIVTADRGLCGSFNSNLIRRAIMEFSKSDSKEKSIMSIGRKGYDHLRRREYSIAEHFIDLFIDLEFTHAQKISAALMEYYINKKVDKILIVYNEFKSAVQQQIVVEQFLPIQPAELDDSRYPLDFIFEPRPDKILRQLCPLNQNVQMWRILLESSASEFGARMTAMETASENAEDMIRELVLFYNKARQAAITKEISEIVGGAEALRG